MATKIEHTSLYKSLSRRVNEMVAAPSDLLATFDELRKRLEAEGKYIVTIFPEYTPHDWVDHISNLFFLADRLLGLTLYKKLRPAELTLLAFGLAAHDWGMAVSNAELAALKGDETSSTFALLPGEPEVAARQVAMSVEAGTPSDIAWREYLRETSGRRSGARLRQFLAQTSTVFSEAVAKIAEGHTLDTQEIRDPTLYPISMSVFGEAVNLAALATYVRLVDLLDIGEDRTPYVLWRFVAPKDRVSKMHWDRHRALSPVSVKQGDAFRRVVITGSTSNPETYAALADLQSWIDSQFDQSINTLRTIPGSYDVDLDSRIDWMIHAVGFEPLKLRFELDRSRILQLLSSELYDRDSLVFLRELLQNSVDAIDARGAVLSNEGASLRGEIEIRITTDTDGFAIEWRDNGIGMDEKILQSFFCKIGHSWYQSKEAQNLSGLDAISQFGVGILSCFTVSDEVQVETRRDPNVTDTRDGFLVEIPSRNSYFRVRKASGAAVGTCVRLKIRQQDSRYVSKESVCKAIVRISRFVEHRIKIECDGVTVHWGFATESQNRILATDFVVPARGDVAGVIAANTNVIEVAISDAGRHYTGIYRALFPVNPAQVESTEDHSVWKLSDTSIEFDDVIIQSEQAIFLKGVQAGVVGASMRGRGFSPNERLRILAYTYWAQPTLLVNLKKPSLVDVNLSRSQIRVKSDKTFLALHSDIAARLASTVFGGLSQDPGQNALILGAIACFGGIPTDALSSLLLPEDIPVLVLGSDNGLHWRKLGEYTSAPVFLEAPFDLKYAWENQCRTHSLDFGRSFRWGGQDVLVTELSSNRHPWLRYVLSIVRGTLNRLGWRPTAIRTVAPPSTERIPLICREWTRGVKENFTQMGSKRWKDEPVWHGDSPELLDFPNELRGYAAFGSRYWNSSHKKIQVIVTVLIELRRQFEHGALSEEAGRKYQYLTSHSFRGYVVPSRISGPTLALSLPNKLLDLASEIGLSTEYRLDRNDFYPGTVGEYLNPYHYPLSSWVKSEDVFGRDVATC